MNFTQKNLEDFEKGEPLNWNNGSFQCIEKYSGEKYVMKVLAYNDKQSRQSAIRQLGKYQFLDTTRGYQMNENDENVNYSIMNKIRENPENNYINKYKYYTIDQTSEQTRDEAQYLLNVFSDPMQQSLEEKIQKKSRFNDYFSTREMKLLVKTIFSALEYMDNKSLAHFNLKPSNILFTSTHEDDTYKLSDYGLESSDFNADQIWEAPEIQEGQGNSNDFLNLNNYDTYKESQNKREYNSLNPLHINFDPIKFDMFRFGLTLIQTATFISLEELQQFKIQTNDIEIQVNII